jgi:NAD(P)-dependent dehydrogenase (short-subunit alcohol dehydrogenase family)
MISTGGVVMTSSGTIQRVAIIGASGKLGQYMVQQALQRGWSVTAVCREQSVAKLARFAGQIRIVAGDTDNRQVIQQALSDVDAVFCVLVPWGVKGYATGTAQAVLDFSPSSARLVFSCGWHISRDGKDRYGWQLRLFVALFGRLARWARFADLHDQVEACRRIFQSDTQWTVVRCSDLEEGEAEGLPVWREHVGDAGLERNRTRRVDFAHFMLAAAQDPQLLQVAPAISGRLPVSAVVAQGR